MLSRTVIVLGALVALIGALSPGWAQTRNEPSKPQKVAGFDSGRCAAARAAVDDLRRSLRLTFDASAARAGAAFTASWEFGRTTPVDHPAYLVIAFSEPARFRGQGFYALTPNARAPFDMPQALERTRLIVPLHVRGASVRGTAAIVPLIAGELVAEAAIVGPGICGLDRDGGPQATTVAVAPGVPEIVVTDRTAVAAKAEAIASPDGARRIEASEGRYRLIDARTGAVLADRPGTKARFSPTGRFAIAAVEDVYEVLDAIDGARIQSTGGGDLAWDDLDSFLVAGFHGNGLIRIYSTLVENREAASLSGLECRICGAVETVSFKLDLERNLSISAALQKIAAVSLTTSDNFNSEDGWANESTWKTYGDVQNFARTVSKLGGVVTPKRWDMMDGLKFSHIGAGEFDKPGESKFTKALRRFVVKPLSAGAMQITTAMSQPVEPLKAARRGDAFGDLPSAARAERFTRRIADFGLESRSGERFAPAARSVLASKTGALLDGETKPQALANDRSVTIYDTRFAECGLVSGPRGDVLTGGVETFKTLGRPGYGLTILVGFCDGGSAVFLYPTAVLHDSRRPGKFFNLGAGVLEDPNGIGTKCTSALFACEFEAELVDDRYLVSWSKESFAVAVHDLETHTLVNSFVRLPSPDQMRHFSLSKDRKTLLKTDADDRFALLSLEATQKDEKGAVSESLVRRPVLLEGEVVDDEVVAWTPDGRFDATTEGASYVFVRFPGRPGQYTLEQYRAALNVPGLVAKTLAGERVPPAPVVSFPPSIEARPAFSETRIAGSVAFADPDVESVRVYQDGQITNVLPVEQAARGLTLDIARAPGARWVSFVARGKGGLFSLPATFDAGPPPQPRRKLRLLAFGVDAYDDEQLPDLAFARSDAERFHKAIVERSADRLDLLSERLLPQTAKQGEIVEEVRRVVADGQPGETVVLFFAGHGLRAADGAYYLASAETRVDDLAATGVPWKALSDILTTARSRVMIFIDTCHSGAAGTDFFATNDGSAQALLDRVPPGVMIFSASKGREPSLEEAEVNGGVFTSAVIDAIRGDAADIDRNGVIEASEFYGLVKRNVMKQTKGRQTPWFARNEMIGDFGLF